MNFNLISDQDNGYDFQTRFREDIHIKKNSRAYLNFAQLSKLNSVNLTQDQTIRILSNDLMPKYNNSLQPIQISQEITIPKGTYNLRQFQSILELALKKVADESPELYYYSSELDNLVNQQNVTLGYFLEDGTAWKTVPYTIDATNTVNFAYADNVGYTKVTATQTPPQYDCFALSSTHYYHHFYPSQERDVDNNLIYLETSQNIEDMTGNVSFGLVSTEFKALNDQPTVKYTGGNVWDASLLVGADNATPSYLKIIKSFISCDITIERRADGTTATGNKYLNIYQARVGTGGNSPVLNTFDFSTQFTRRVLVASINLSTVYLTTNQPVRIALQTYIPTNNGNFKTNERRVYYRVYLTTSANNINITDDVVFDSMTINSYFSYDFFNTFAVPANENQANSMVPFKIFLSAQSQGEGWAKCIYREFSKASDTATVSRTIMNSYSIEISAQLAEYLENDAIRDAVLGPLYPNHSEENPNDLNFFHSTQLSLDFLNDSYSIIIEELPLKSYKNTEIQANGGYSQHILANIPCPFTNYFNNVTKDTNLISTVFTPSFQSYIEMKNQDFKTNHLRVKIMNMRTNYPATELKQSTINFTIEETQESK